jgi:DNA-binding NarL/FixJ family response regulator
MQPSPDPGAAESAVTVIVADDHPLIREALRHALAKLAPAPRVLEASSLPEALALLESEAAVDLAILDLNMPGMNGFAGLAELRSSQPALPVAIVSATTDQEVMRRALELGAAGFIPKTLPLSGIAEAIRAILAGEIWLPETVQPPANDEIARRLGELTPQQLRVLAMLSQGLANKQIAFALSVGEPTVKAHVTAILRKLGVTSRTQAVIAARLIDLPPPT